jgi:hypothetical protein
VQVWRFLGRVTLLFAWTLVLWGTLVFGSVLFGLVQEGLPALRRLDPHAQPGVWPWINAGSALVAPAVWMLVATAIVLAHRKPVAR